MYGVRVKHELRGMKCIHTFVMSKEAAITSHYSTLHDGATTTILQDLCDGAADL
jgi:hypothetical protein